MKRFRVINILVLLVLMVSTILMTPRPVSAGAYITVTTTADDFGGTTTDTCSLREAIRAANTDTAFGGCPAGNGTDVIYLDKGQYILTRDNPEGVHEDNAAYGDLDIKSSMAIRGAGNDPVDGTVVFLEPNAKYPDRIFHIIRPSTGKISVTMSNFRIQDGSTSEIRGGGAILNDGSKEGSTDIFSTLTLFRMYITSNYAQVEGGGVTNYRNSQLTVRYSTFDTNISADGGGIYNVGKMVLETSLMFGNSGTTTGGGLDNGSNSIATIKNSTIAQNLTNPDAHGGAGISNSGTLHLVNSTIAENNGTGLMVELSLNTVVANTIFAQGDYPNCSRKSDTVPFVSTGYNIVFGDAAIPEGQEPCSFVADGDNVGTGSTVDPQLSSLSYDEGVTKTYGFASTSSPAIDAIPAGNVNCPTIDQRLHGRWADGNEDGVAGCDIGSYEEGGSFSMMYFPNVSR